MSIGLLALIHNWPIPCTVQRSFVNTDHMTILRGDRVLLERRRLNLNQEVLAGQIGVDRTYSVSIGAGDIHRLDGDGDGFVCED